VEAIRVLMADGRSARAERTQTINQARALVLTGPGDLRARFTGHTPAALVSGMASLRPRPGSTVGYATRIALRELGRRAEFPAGRSSGPGELIVPLVTARAPGLLCVYGIGPDTAAVAADRRRGPPAAAALGGRLGAPVRRRADPRLVGEGHPPPPQPRRQPRGQPRAVADRDHPDGQPPRHPRLRRPAHRRGPAGEGHHPLPEALRAREACRHLRAA
jgi:hypothetical protein